MTNQMPERIYAWMGMQDNGSWDNNPCPCTSHESVEYVRADLTQKTVTVEDFEAMWIRAYEGSRNSRFGNAEPSFRSLMRDGLIAAGVVKLID